MVRVLIPSFYQAKRSGQQSFTVYCLEVYHNGKVSKQQHRYRDFHRLHKQLSKVGQRVPFPPKKVRNTSIKFLEQRRMALEAYMQAIIRFQPPAVILLDFLGLPSNAFAAVDSITFDSGLTTDDSDDEAFEDMAHQPIIGFSTETNRFPFVGLDPPPTVETPGLAEAAGGSNTIPSVNVTAPSPSGPSHSRHSSSSSSLTDCVLKGTLDALYSTNEDEFCYVGI